MRRISALLLVVLLSAVLSTTYAQWVKMACPSSNIWGNNCEFTEIEGYLFVGTYGGVFVSTDTGKSWNRADSGLPTSHNIIAIAANGTNLFAGTDDRHIYRSIDSAKTWTGSFSGCTSIRCFQAARTSIPELWVVFFYPQIQAGTGLQWIQVSRIFLQQLFRTWAAIFFLPE
jgi:photosystem II stability/assembly factor-like uncharacterized protein